MQIARSANLEFIPASHEDPKDPGCLKKVLFVKDQLCPGRLQMINWSLLPAGKSFKPHYHQDMDEVFIILSGQAEIRINDEQALLQKGDAVLVPMKSIHEMRNAGTVDVEYIALGVTLNQGGKTINV